MYRKKPLFSFSSHFRNAQVYTIVFSHQFVLLSGLGFGFLFCLLIVGNDRFADAEWRAEICDPAGGKADKGKQSYHSVRKHH